MKTKEQTPIEWFAEQLGITSGTTFLKAKDMEANINWLLDKQIKDLTAENEIYKNKLADFESEMIRQMIFGDLSTNSIQAKEKLAVTIQAKDSNYENSNKTLTNTTASQAKDNVKDIVFWGNGDTFKLISKASSVKESWMKSTKAMEIEGVGCVVQVTTQQGDNVAEALTFVPNVRIEESYGRDESVVSRRLIKI